MSGGLIKPSSRESNPTSFLALSCHATYKRDMHWLQSLMYQVKPMLGDCGSAHPGVAGGMTVHDSHRE